MQSESGFRTITGFELISTGSTSNEPTPSPIRLPKCSGVKNSRRLSSEMSPPVPFEVYCQRWEATLILLAIVQCDVLIECAVSMQHQCIRLKPILFATTPD